LGHLLVERQANLSSSCVVFALFKRNQEAVLHVLNLGDVLVLNMPY